MSQSKAERIVTRLLSNATGLNYGCVSVTVKLHDGKVVQVLYSTTEKTMDKKQKAEDEQ